MGIDILLFVVGLAVLYFGAEFLVDGSSAVALRLGITPLMVGLTVVAFGTSSPELLVCLVAAFKGTDDISVGNILGSNIANIALILGCASVIRPMEVHSQIVRREFAVMAVASIMLVLVSLDGRILRVEGMLLAISMVFYLVYTFYSGDDDAADPGGESEVDEVDEVDPDTSQTWADWLRIVGGTGGLAGGAYLMVESATAIALDLGISELVIGITIVAFGTSLPELATSVVAAFREEADISVGNVIGSNIFNIFLVIGLTAVVMPIVVGETAINIDMWIMLVVAIGIWPILRSGHRISRAEGISMLMCYGGYIAYLFVRPA